MATQAAIEESQEVLEPADSAGRMGPTEKSRAVPKIIKKKLTLPISGEVDLPQAVREAMNYRVEMPIYKAAVADPDGNAGEYAV